MDITIPLPREDDILSAISPPHSNIELSPLAFHPDIIIPPPQIDESAPSPISDDEVQLINTISRREAHVNAPRDFADKWIIIFPVHSGSSSGAEHWTLGILVNVKHDKDRLEQPLKEWHLFHFDSCPGCNSRSKTNAMGLAQFLTYTEDKEDIRFRDIPVPRQQAGSNDCGLYLSHFMKIFLGDPEFFINYCLVCGLFFSKTLTTHHL
jgi:hypothetical protein